MDDLGGTPISGNLYIVCTRDRCIDDIKRMCIQQGNLNMAIGNPAYVGGCKILHQFIGSLSHYL